MLAKQSGDSNAAGGPAPWLRRAGSVVWERGKGLMSKAAPHMTVVRVRSCLSPVMYHTEPRNIPHAQPGSMSPGQSFLGSSEGR